MSWSENDEMTLKALQEKQNSHFRDLKQQIRELMKGLPEWDRVTLAKEFIPLSKSRTDEWEKMIRGKHT